VVALQDKSSNTDNTGKTGEGLAGTASDRRLTRLGLDRGLSRHGAGNLGAGRSLSDGDGGNSGVGEDTAGVADNNAGGDHGLGDGARAVGDGEGGGLSDGVGLGAVGDLSGLRAVGGVGLDNLGHNGDVGVAVTVSVGGDTNGGSKDDSGELHFDGIKGYSVEWLLGSCWC